MKIPNAYTNISETKKSNGVIIADIQFFKFCEMSQVFMLSTCVFFQKVCFLLSILKIELD